MTEENINSLVETKMNGSQSLGQIEYGGGYASDIYPVLRLFPEMVYDKWLIGPGDANEIHSIAIVNQSFKDMYDPNKLIIYCYSEKGASLGKMEFNEWETFAAAFQFIPNKKSN